MAHINVEWSIHKSQNDADKDLSVEGCSGKHSDGDNYYFFTFAEGDGGRDEFTLTFHCEKALFAFLREAKRILAQTGVAEVDLW